MGLQAPHAGLIASSVAGRRQTLSGFRERIDRIRLLTPAERSRVQRRVTVPRALLDFRNETGNVYPKLLW